MWIMFICHLLFKLGKKCDVPQKNNSTTSTFFLWIGQANFHMQGIIMFAGMIHIVISGV